MCTYHSTEHNNGCRTNVMITSVILIVLLLNAENHSVIFGILIMHIAKMAYAYQSYLAVILLVWLVNCERDEVCNAKTFKGECPINDVVVIQTASYGRMRLGQCIEVDLGYLGCQNDVMFLLDRWCSGRHSCDVFLPNENLDNANTECNIKGLTSYLEVEYECMTVASYPGGRCASPTHLDLRGNEGYISSHVTSQTGCGSPRAPWIIEVPPGQTIDLSLLDFGALGRRGNTLGLGCQQTLGFIVERNLGSNFTICGGRERRNKLYSSKTNKVEITLLTSNAEHASAFMLQYRVIGCSNLSPPAHAWHKREGSDAVIGCKSNDRVWRLYCNGNTWDGVVGNCSETTSDSGQSNVKIDLPFSSVIFLTSVVCGAILLIIVVVVAGAVYVKRQSIQHEMKLRSDYACTTLSSAQYFPAKTPGYDVTMCRPVTQTTDHQPLVQISDSTLPGQQCTLHRGGVKT